MSKIKNIIKMLLPGYNISEKIYLLYKFSYLCNKKKLKVLSNYLSYKIYRKYNCCISSNASITKGILFPHPVGIVIGDGVIIGKNTTIYQNVTLGRKYSNIANYPKIGDNVKIYANATIIGNVKIGNNVVIGCNSVVLRDVKDGETVLGIVK